MSAGYFWFGVDVGNCPLGAASRPKNFFQTHFQKVCAVTAPLESVSRRTIVVGLEAGL